MLTAYYDCSCDSRELFSDKVIAESENFDDHLNQYNVILLDVSGFVSEVKKYGGLLDSLKSVPAMIERALWKDLVESGFRLGEGDSLNDFLIRIVEQSCGKPFIFIMDKWEIIIREGRDAKEAQEAYLSLLRNWFQNSSFTPKVVAAAFMTVFLAIKKGWTGAGSFWF